MIILFVDDEDRVLTGMKRMLRRYKDEWDMHFVNSGEAALRMLQERSFDLIVSDVLMPGMDGITLLEKVQREFPDIVRIILSGHVDRIDSLRSTGVAHQYLAKPCDPDLLRSTIAKSSALHKELNSPELIAAIAGTHSLPSAPSLYLEIVRELKSEDPSLTQVAAIVARDAAMSAKILQLVNSAFFASRRKLSDVKQAVALLGTETIVALVLSSHLFRAAEATGPQAAALENIRTRSLSVAMLAKTIRASEHGSASEAAEAFLAGILHDCGKLVLIENWPDQYPEFAEDDDLLREAASFGADHALVGAHLLATWGLPHEIIEAVAYHHRPSSSTSRDVSALCAVHVAHAVQSANGADPSDRLDMQYITETQLDGHVETWLQIAADAQEEPLKV